MAYALFHMWGGFRQHLIASHVFYVEQSHKRLLSQFNNMESEAEKFSEELLENSSKYFDPDRHEPGDFYEMAYDEGIEFYQLLEDMKNRTYLSVVSGIFHEWEKQLRGWMLNEISHWHQGEEVKKAIWRANFIEIIKFFETLGWSIKSRGYYASLDRCRLVTNVFKHGEGGAFNVLKSKHPEFISTVKMDGMTFIEFSDYSDLKIDKKHIAEFSEAIIDFWNDVPEYIHSSDSLNLPSWFEKAYSKDQANKTEKVT